MLRACHWECVCLSGFVCPVNPSPSPFAFLLSRVPGTCGSPVAFAPVLVCVAPRGLFVRPPSLESPRAGLTCSPERSWEVRPGLQGFSTAWSANASYSRVTSGFE